MNTYNQLLKYITMIRVVRKEIFTICNSFEEANELGRYIVRHGYEGLYNDSYRGCETAISFDFRDNVKEGRPFLYVGVKGCSLSIGKTKEDISDCKFIEDTDTFKKELTGPREDIPARDWKSISFYGPGYLLGKKIQLMDGSGYNARDYSGTVTNYSYTNRGLVLRIDNRDIQTLPDTKILVTD